MGQQVFHRWTGGRLGGCGFGPAPEPPKRRRAGWQSQGRWGVCGASLFLLLIVNVAVLQYIFRIFLHTEFAPLNLHLLPLFAAVARHSSCYSFTLTSEFKFLFKGSCLT